MLMRDLEFTIHIKYYESGEALPASYQTLINKAKEAAQNAYAPYSHFKVGAALLLADGSIVTGNNQENIAYPSGLCAERVAIYHASATKPGVEIEAIAVEILTDVVVSGASPCGSCRQAMAEYETKQNKPIIVIMPAENGGHYVADSIDDLLPFQFKAKLKK